LSQVSAFGRVSFPRVNARYIAVWLIGVLFAVSALSTLGIALLVVASTQQLDYMEPIIYGQASRILHGEALYQAVQGPPYTVTGYTPLYYVVGALGQAMLGPGFAWGRSVSILACLVTIGCIGFLAARIAGRGLIGGLAAAIFLAFAFPGPVPWFALYRVDVLGVALSFAAITVLASGTSRPQLVLAAVLAALALLTKQTFFSATVAGLIWLWPSGWRRAVVFGGTVALIVLSTTVVLESATGAFIANTIWANMNPFGDPFSFLVPTLVATQFVPLVGAAFFLADGRPWQAPVSRLLILYWLGTIIPVLGIAKVGAAWNYWIEFAAATSILSACGIWLAAVRCDRWLRDLVSMLIICLILIVAAGVAWADLAGGGVASAYAHANDVSETDADFERLVTRVRSEPKLVLAQPLDVVVLADRGIELEPVIYSIFLAQGYWDAGPLVERICHNQVGLLVLGQPLQTAARVTIANFRVWPEPVLAALDRTMMLEGSEAGRFVYIPRIDRGGATSGTVCPTTIDSGSMSKARE
jgi:hypothetical protein